MRRAFVLLIVLALFVPPCASYPSAISVKRAATQDGTRGSQPAQRKPFGFLDEIKRRSDSLQITQLNNSVFLLWPNVPGAASYVVMRNDAEIERLPAGERSLIVDTFSPEAFFDLRKTRITRDTYTLLALASDGSILRTLTATTSCPSAAVIVARGSGENLDATRYAGSRGAGFLGVLRKELGATEQSLPALAVNFPAVAIFNGANLAGGAYPSLYQSSVQQGIHQAARSIRDTITVCPETALVLFGYSQGGQVIGDAYANLSEQERQHVARVVLFAEARYRPGDPSVNYLPLPLPGSGIKGARPPFPARSAAVVDSWCAASDAICQGLGYGRRAHGPEYDAFEGDAARRTAAALRPRTERVP